MNRPSLEVERRRTEGTTPDFLEDFLWQLAFVEQRVTELAQAIPQEKYNWRPTPETRLILQSATAYRSGKSAGGALVG